MDLCRCCYYKISIESSKDLLVESYNGVKFVDALYKITDVEISEDDEFPKKICHHCYEILLFVCDFITLVKRTDNKFRDSINDKSTNSISVVDRIKSKIDETNSDAEEIISEVDVFSNYYDVDTSKSTDDQDTSENIIVVDSDSDRNVSTTDKDCKDSYTSGTSDGIKERKCPFCHKCFQYPAKVKRHLAVHTKPFKCTICDKICLGASTFKEHTKMHKSNSLYKCSKCDKSYTQKRDLKNHMFCVHNSRMCFVCNELFDFDQIEVHLLSHGHDKRITCQICKDSFEKGKNLEKHLKEHYKKGVFPCHICGKRFPRMYNLNRHLQSNVHRSSPKKQKSS